MNLQSLFLREKSFEGYDDHAVLECLLKTAGVRGDIPSMITSLYDAFGNFRAILEAKPIQLMQVPNVTKKAAAIIAMVAPLARVWERCNMTNPDKISNSREAERYCKSLLMGERTKRFYVVCLNAKCNVLGARKISEGSLCEVSCYPRIVAETALNYNSHSVLLCHNHPNQTCAPSPEDICSTLMLQRMLNAMGILILDHIVVSGSDTYSMIAHGDINYRARGAA